MTDAMTLDAFGSLIEPATLKIQRLLPGSVDRVWGYLTQSELRRQWLASGPMEMAVDSPFELVWRNDELTDPPGKRPEGFPTEHRMESRILALEPNRTLAIAWNQGEVWFGLEPQGDQVLLTIVHKRLPDRSSTLNVSAGWHMHLDVLAAKIAGKQPASTFWEGWQALKAQYEQRLPE